RLADGRGVQDPRRTPSERRAEGHARAGGRHAGEASRPPPAADRYGRAAAEPWRHAVRRRPRGECRRRRTHHHAESGGMMDGTWLEDVGTQLWTVAEAFGREMRGEGVIALLRPVAPFNRPNFL